jgi:hypothetical protein
MKKIVYASLSLLSLAIHALEFDVKNNTKDPITMTFMIDQTAPYALQNKMLF